MRNPIKVGERVAVYYGSGRVVGEVEKEYPSGALEIKFDHCSSRRSAHPKQCRRLVKKKDSRRRFWINIYPPGNFIGYRSAEYSTYNTKETADGAAGRSRIECIEVIEVIKKKQ